MLRNCRPTACCWRVRFLFWPISQNPSFRVRCGDLCRDPGSKQASPERTQEDPGCPEHCPQWFCTCASRLGDAGLVVPCLCQVFCWNLFYKEVLQYSKGGLSKGGLGPKGANWAKKGSFGAISALPPWLWGAEELVPIGPEKAPIGPEKVPICPEKARFSQEGFPPDFLWKFGA